MNSTKSSKLIVFEGIDGVGKSTLSLSVVDRLRGDGVNAKYFSFPGKEDQALGSLVYKIHHNVTSFGLDNMHAASLQLLHIAAHVDSIVNNILPELERGNLVVLDRYWWSTVAYGVAMGIPYHIIKLMISIEKNYWKGITPDILYLVNRKEIFNPSSPYDLQLTKVYSQLVNKEKNRYTINVIDNDYDLQQVIDPIINEIENIFNKVNINVFHN
jgi:dTMP kinase